MHLTAHLPGNLAVKKIHKSVKNWQNYGHESMAPFLAHPAMYIGYAMLLAMSAVQRRDYTSERASLSSPWLLGLEECACECQIWNWVIGSPGQWVIWVIFHVRVTESPGHHCDPVWDSSFSGFRKKCPKCKTYIWNAKMTKVIVRCLLLDWNHWMSVYAMNFFFHVSGA